MNKKFGLTAYLASATLLSTTVVNAADYVLDEAHTQIRFGVSHQGFSTSRGSFTDFTGAFSFDPESVESSSAEVVIQSASLDMDDATWSRHLNGEPWFSVEEHPTITFKSTSVEDAGDDQFKINGELTMLGIAKPVVLDAKLNKVGEAMGKPKAGFSATGTLDRADWGMSTFAPMIGLEISLTIEVEGYQVTE